MTKAELTRLIHSAFYRVVRSADPSSQTTFLKAKLEDTMPAGGTPSGWGGFWYESLAVEIEAAVMTRREYILNFDAVWLKNNKSKTWKVIRDHIAGNLVPLA